MAEELAAQVFLADVSPGAGGEGGDKLGQRGVIHCRGNGGGGVCRVQI